MSAIPTSQKRPFIPAPGVAQIEMVYRYNGQTCENVYHVKVAGSTTPLTSDQLTTIGALFIDWEHNHGINMRSNAVTLTKVRARALDEQAGTTVELTPTVAVTGADTTQVMPGNVTAAIRWNTGLGGRSFRGRTYHIGMTAQQVSGDQIASNWITNYVNGYTFLYNLVTGNMSLQLVVVSYAHNKFWRSTALATPVIGLSVDPDIDSQRRRLNKRGQ